MSPRDHVLPLPLPRASTVERDAIAAAEALALLRVTRVRCGGVHPSCWICAERHEEAQAALRILAASLVDETDNESDERVITVRSMAGRLRLYDLEARDLEGFEARCREIAAEVTRG